VTQIELRSCPFCDDDCSVIGASSPAMSKYIVMCNGCSLVLHGIFPSKEAAIFAWNTRTTLPAPLSPVAEKHAEIEHTHSPASPTRSDTREQAAASPSAVGEVQVTDAMTYAGLLALRDVGYHDETIDTEHMKIAIAAALSSQAPKPASAGGDFAEDARDVLDRFYWMLSPDAKGNHTVKHLSVKAVIRLCEKIIAAEADTAKESCGDVCKLARSTGVICAEGECDIASDHRRAKAADRLAPIEARGVEPLPSAADRVAGSLRFILDADACGCGIPDCAREAARKWLDVYTALRASESAPAVEPPPAGA
jgi:hypothetical protein